MVLGSASPDGDLLQKFKTFHVTPWAKLRTLQLEELGLSRKGVLTYMVLNSDAVSWNTISDLEVRTVESNADMDEFSEVQCRGFLEKQEIYDSWAPFLREANHHNLNNKNQKFYIGALNGKPLGVVLSVFTELMAGIYAVATLPEYRKKGVSAAILQKAIIDAKLRGCQVVTLQVVQGSYAETFYHKLGFETAFQTEIFVR